MKKIGRAQIKNVLKIIKNNAIINDRELEKSFKGEISGKPNVEF